MRYGFISRRSEETKVKHIEALKPYDLMEIIVDDFENDIDTLFRKLETGDSLYMEEPPRDITKYVAIRSYARKHGIELYIRGELIGETPVIKMLDECVKAEKAQRRV